jgi:hypothetical protein
MTHQSENPSQDEAQRQHTDAAEVALRVGVSASLVRKVILGTRKNDKVSRAYQLLLKERAKAQQKFQSDKKGA